MGDIHYRMVCGPLLIPVFETFWDSSCFSECKAGLANIVSPRSNRSKISKMFQLFMPSWSYPCSGFDTRCDCKWTSSLPHASRQSWSWLTQLGSPVTRRSRLSCDCSIGPSLLFHPVTLRLIEIWQNQLKCSSVQQLSSAGMAVTSETLKG